MSAGPIVLVFAVVFAVVVGAFWLFVQRPEQKSTEALHRRLKVKPEAIDEDDGDDAGIVERQPTHDRRRLEGLATSAGGGILRYLAVQLERANMEMPPGHLLAIATSVGLVGAVVLGMASPLWIVTIPLGLAAGWLPIAWVRFRGERRVRKFEEQFPEAIELIARALRAGHAMTTGLALVAEELPDPVGGEFRLVYDRQNFGMSMPDALRLFAERVPLLDARFFVTAVLTQRESGGNLAEILDNLGDVIRQRFRVKRQIRVVTAHARLTGWVLVLMPVVIGLGMVVVAPDHILTLVRDPLGLQLAAAAAGLWVVGFLAIRKLVDVEY
jgi:tight adherence protein B